MQTVYVKESVTRGAPSSPTMKVIVVWEYFAKLIEDVTSEEIALKLRSKNQLRLMLEERPGKMKNEMKIADLKHLKM